SDAAQATDATSASGTADGIVNQTGPATTLTLDPSDLQCPTRVAPSASLNLTLSLQDASVLKFMAANANSAKVSVTLTPLDAQGNALTTLSGQPFSIRQTVQVL
ncbi:MAG TPA: hypothetical protein V6D47_02560, partial [Oscillatoriaceae cyanobacterium]